MSKTWGEVAAEFIACKNPEEAKVWLSKEVESHAAEWGYTHEQSEHILRDSLGYMMGYYSDEEAAHMQSLLNLTHPILPWVGKRPTTKADTKIAFEMGMFLAKKDE